MKEKDKQTLQRHILMQSTAPYLAFLQQNYILFYFLFGDEILYILFLLIVLYYLLIHFN